jgi:hypothetical protein
MRLCSHAARTYVRTCVRTCSTYVHAMLAHVHACSAAAAIRACVRTVQYVRTCNSYVCAVRALRTYMQYGCVRAACYSKCNTFTQLRTYCTAHAIHSTRTYVRTCNTYVLCNTAACHVRTYAAWHIHAMQYYIHTYIHIYTYIHAYIIHIHTCIHTYIQHAYIHTYIHTYRVRCVRDSNIRSVKEG